MLYNGEDFMKALQLATELKFEQYQVSERHFENSFDLFTDDNGGTWSIEPTYNDKFNICYGMVKVSVIGLDLEKELNNFIEFELEVDEIQKNADQEYKDYNNELWKNYGYGKN